MTTSTHGHRGSWILLLLAAVQVAMTAVQFLGGRSPGGRGVDLLISPAPYAFGIWGVIYLLCVVHGVAVARRGTGVEDRVALIVPLSVLYVGSALWSIAFTVGNSWLTFAVLVVMAAAALRAFVVVTNFPVHQGVPRWMVLLERFTVGLYAGWATIAVFVNLASAIGDQGLADARSVGWQFAVLVGALAALLAALRWGRGSAGYAVAAVWALAAVSVNVSGESTALAVAGAVGIVAVVAVSLWSHKRYSTT